ncbi:hypothetical protein [Clostridium thermobutyricum]|nr:hypothetical protein [Clostridium thermobutyricum]OPX47617.1 hypothetical protein CLTHE_17310 [Clostridium thermobutyricum DSM 4928]
MKKKVLVLLIVASIATMVACGSKSQESVSSGKPQIEKNEDSNKDDKKEETEVDKNKDEDINKEDKNGEGDNKVEDTTSANSSTKIKGTSTFRIYNVDSNNYKLDQIAAFKTDDLTIKENLDKIASEVQRVLFPELKLKVEEVKDGIAKVNLTNGIDKWTDYMQGSTGGEVTQKILIENFLQKSHKGEWIKGVKFTLDGKDIKMDHVPDLENINYR